MIPLLALTLVTGTVVAVHDGDGPIRVETPEGIVKVRLRGIQAPDFETAEPCRQHRAGYVCDDRRATIARDRMRALVLHKPVTIRPDGGRSYGREVAWLTLPDGRDVSCEAIRLGIATRWPRYDPAGRLRRCEGAR